MSNFKVIIPGLFDGIASSEQLEDMYNRGYYTDLDGPSPKEVTVDGVVVDKESMAALFEKPVLEEYQLLRKYPSIEDQLDTIYHLGLDVWKTEIKAIKDASPKV